MDESTRDFSGGVLTRLAKLLGGLTGHPGWGWVGEWQRRRGGKGRPGGSEAWETWRWLSFTQLSQQCLVGVDAPAWVSDSTARREKYGRKT